MRSRRRKTCPFPVDQDLPVARDEALVGSRAAVRIRWQAVNDAVVFVEMDEMTGVAGVPSNCIQRSGAAVSAVLVARLARPVTVQVLHGRTFRNAVGSVFHVQTRLALIGILWRISHRSRDTRESASNKFHVCMYIKANIRMALLIFFIRCLHLFLVQLL